MAICSMYGYGTAGLIKVGREVAGQWRVTRGSRLLRAARGAPEDLGSREDGCLLVWFSRSDEGGKRGCRAMENF